MWLKGDLSFGRCGLGVGTRRQAGSNSVCRANERRLCIGEWTGKGRGRVNQTTVCTRSMGGILFGTSRPHVLLLVAPFVSVSFLHRGPCRGDQPGTRNVGSMDWWQVVGYRECLGEFTMLILLDWQKVQKYPSLREICVIRGLNENNAVVQCYRVGIRASANMRFLLCSGSKDSIDMFSGPLFFVICGKEGASQEMQLLDT